ncbi:hypothetical protein NL676_017777 [Syzygium grande]|nr:hypothetical protein NL676_017777 [Syzygium grande]
MLETHFRQDGVIFKGKLSFGETRSCQIRRCTSTRASCFWILESQARVVKRNRLAFRHQQKKRHEEKPEVITEEAEATPKVREKAAETRVEEREKLLLGLYSGSCT